MESPELNTPLLDKLAKEKSFSTPENYFSNASKEILSKTVGSKVVATKLTRKIAAIATLAIIITACGLYFSGVFDKQTTTEQDENIINNNTQNDVTPVFASDTNEVVTNEEAANETEIAEEIRTNSNPIKKTSKNKTLSVSDFCSVYTWPQKICIEKETTLNAEVIGDYDYKWNTGATTPKINVNKSGVYTVTITAENNKSDKISKTIIVNNIPVPILQTENFFDICKGDSLAVSIKQNCDLYKYHWKQLNSDKHTEYVKESGMFYVEIIGCNSYVDSFYVRTHHCDIYIDDILDKTDTKLIVNDIEKYSNTAITIKDNSNKVIYKSSNYLNDWNIEELKNGLYHYTIEFSDGEVINGKFKIKR